MLKLNRLLYSTTDSNLFIHQIEPTAAQRKVLVDAKTKIREYLKPRVAAATVKVLGIDRAVTPRFRTQGSWAYQTCVQSAFAPPQEMDWDYGMYLPMTVWEENGPPHAMAKAYFSLVEGLLADLCKQEGWKMNQPEPNNNCIRIHVSTTAHIDLPLYAADAAEFEKIVEREAVAKGTMVRADSVSVFDSAQTWDQLKHIVLATRKGEWKKSDPQQVANWFKDRMLEHRDQLRRVCRYLKAWRDFHWKSGGPSSVLMMIIVARNFVCHHGRDDLALEAAAAVLARDFNLDVHVRAINEGAENFNRLSTEERNFASAKAASLYETIRQARMLNVSYAQTAVDKVRSVLGQRVPDRVALVEPDAGELSIRETPARRQPPPAVAATSAG